VVWASSVGIATRYRLDGVGIKSRWWRDFSHPSRPALGATQPPLQWVLGLIPGRKAAEASIAEVKERVGLYLFSVI